MSRAEAFTGSALKVTGAVAPKLAARIACFLFANPLRRGKVLPLERSVHERAVREEMTVGGKRVVSYRWGDGQRPVLLLHGWRSRASRYAGFVPRLEALGLSPVSFDEPGHGDSGGRATTILEYREIIHGLQKRYGDFHSVVAHSFGVTCAFLALREGVRAGRLVAVSGVSSFGFLAEEFARILALTPRLGRDLRTGIEERLFPGVEDLWTRFDATCRPSEVTVPVLIMHDTDDVTVPLEQARLLMKAYGTRAELITTSGLGHRKILAEPEVIDGALAFIKLDGPHGTAEPDGPPEGESGMDVIRP